MEFLNGPRFAMYTIYDLFEASGKRVTVNGKYLDKTIEQLGIKDDAVQLKLEEDPKEL